MEMQHSHLWSYWNCFSIFVICTSLLLRSQLWQDYFYGQLELRHDYSHHQQNQGSKTTPSLLQPTQKKILSFSSIHHFLSCNKQWCNAQEKVVHIWLVQTVVTQLLTTPMKKFLWCQWEWTKSKMTLLCLIGDLFLYSIISQIGESCSPCKIRREVGKASEKNSWKRGYVK